MGAGIFRTPSIVATGVGNSAELLAVWGLGALIAIAGALCYGELASAYPHPGGDYHFLRRAFGARLSFLYAWARLTVIQTGSVAVLAFVFGDYLSQVLPLGPGSSAIWAAAAVALITLINWLGVRQGARAQNMLTILEVAGLSAVVIAGLVLAPAAEVQAVPAPTTELGLVMVFVLLTYGGWNEAAYVSAELKGGPRRMASVLMLSLLVVATLYLLVNLAYVRALGLGGMVASEAVAADVMRKVGGGAGAALIAAAVAIAALTSANATVITGARSAFALGSDHRAFRLLGAWHEPSGVPRRAILVQGGLALLLVLIGAGARSGFETAVEYTAPVFWFFFLLVGIALFVLRARDPGRPRPFRVPLYPVVPALFCLANLYLLWSSLAYTGVGALFGVAVLAAGMLLLVFVQPFSQAKEPSP